MVEGPIERLGMNAKSRDSKASRDKMTHEIVFSIVVLLDPSVSLDEGPPLHNCRTLWYNSLLFPPFLRSPVFPTFFFFSSMFLFYQFSLRV